MPLDTAPENPNGLPLVTFEEIKEYSHKPHAEQAKLQQDAYEHWAAYNKILLKGIGENSTQIPGVSNPGLFRGIAGNVYMHIWKKLGAATPTVTLEHFLKNEAALAHGNRLEEMRNIMEMENPDLYNTMLQFIAQQGVDLKKHFIGAVVTYGLLREAYLEKLAKEGYN